MKNGLIVVSLTLLAACTSVEPRQTSDTGSSKGYMIKCHSIDGSTKDCLREAEKVCEQGFSVLEKHSHLIEYANSGDGFYMPPKHELAIACKEG